MTPDEMAGGMVPIAGRGLHHHFPVPGFGGRKDPVARLTPPVRCNINV